MRRIGLPFMALAAICMPSAVSAAYVFATSGDNATISMGGDAPGLSSIIYLQLTGVSSNIYTFNYTVTNTSNTALNPSSRVSGFGFVTNPLPTSAGSSINGGYSNLRIQPPPGQLSPQVAAEGLCASNSGSCSGPGGATFGSPASGVLTLAFGAPTSSLTLSDFGVRYQSTGLDARGSGRGFEAPVPEPGTWALMLLGFGGIGFALRRNRKAASANPQLA